MENNLKKGKNCIGQKVIDTDGNEGIITDFYTEGKNSKVCIEYSDGTSQIRDKYAVKKGNFRKPYVDDIDECLASKKWKYIPKFNMRYIISERGEIKSAQGINKGKVLSPSIDTGGYYIIGLQVDKNRNNRKLCRVHRLVVETFLRIPSKNEEVNHIDGNKTNNNLSNLEIISRESNNKKYLDLLELGLSVEEIQNIQEICLEQKITIKEFLFKKIKGE